MWVQLLGESDGDTSALGTQEDGGKGGLWHAGASEEFVDQEVPLAP